MAKHLSKSSIKRKPKLAPNKIRIPDIKKIQRKKDSLHREDQTDFFHNAMLNKTLDRKISLADVVLTGLALVFLIAAYFLPTSGPVRLLTFIVPFLLAGYSYLFEGFQEAFMGIVFGREFIIIIAALLALASGAWFGAAAIMICLKISDLALASIERRQNEKIRSLYALRPEKTNLVIGDSVKTVNASDIQPESVIEVGIGDIVPIDGIVISGTSVLDASDIVGESFSYTVAAGSSAISGCRNINEILRIRTDCTQSSSVSSMLIRSAENSWMHKSAQERLLQRILSYLSPALVILSILLAAVPSIATGEWRIYFVRAAILLTVSQMYSLIQSVKLTYDCASACAAVSGVVVKGHDVFETLSKAETMVFDKTGTVTVGEYRIKEVFPRGVTEGQLLFLAGAAEMHSHHPIAKAIISASGVYASDINVEDISEIPGRGVNAFIDGRCVYVGNASLMEEHDVAVEPPSIPGTAIHVAVDGRYLGHIVLDDALRDDAFDVIEELRAAGVETSVLLTGDIHSSARRIASSLNFDLVKAELTPEEKCKSVEYLMSNRNVNTTLAFIGDGDCDGDALKLATVGIAFGCFDKPSAIENADAAILNRGFRTLPKLYRLSRRAANCVIQDTAVCGAVKLLVLIFGAAGLCPLSLAVLFQLTAVLFYALNADRVLGFGENRRRNIMKERIKRT